MKTNTQSICPTVFGRQSATKLKLDRAPTTKNNTRKQFPIYIQNVLLWLIKRNDVSNYVVDQMFDTRMLDSIGLGKSKVSMKPDILFKGIRFQDI